MDTQETRGTYMFCWHRDCIEARRGSQSEGIGEGLVACPSCMHPLVYGPKLTVDAIIEYEDRLVLIQRARHGKGTGQWALAGGYVDFRERVAHAVVREAREETGLRLVRPEFLGLYDDPERDRRFGRNNVSVVYTARARGRLRLPPDGEVAAIRGCTREEIEDGRFRPTREDMILVAKFRTLRSGKTTVTIDPNGRRKHQRGKLTLAFDHGQILADYFARSD